MLLFSLLLNKRFIDDDEFDKRGEIKMKKKDELLKESDKCGLTSKGFKPLLEVLIDIRDKLGKEGV